MKPFACNFRLNGVSSFRACSYGLNEIALSVQLWPILFIKLLMALFVETCSMPQQSTLRVS